MTRRVFFLVTLLLLALGLALASASASASAAGVAGRRLGQLRAPVAGGVHRLSLREAERFATSLQPAPAKAQAKAKASAPATAPAAPAKAQPARGGGAKGASAEQIESLLASLRTRPVQPMPRQPETPAQLQPAAPGRAPKGRSLVEAEAELRAASGAAVYPPSGPTMQIGGLKLNDVRQAVRGNVADVDGSNNCPARAKWAGVAFVAAAPLINGGGLADVCYYLDGQGRVREVYVASIVLGGGTDWIQPAGHYCDVLFDPQQTLGAWADDTGLRSPIQVQGLPANYYLRYSSVFEVGHVVAASLGGSNRDPLNFFPQYANANRGAGSYWYAMEGTARDLKAACQAVQATLLVGTVMPNNCVVSVDLRFTVGLGVTNMPAGVHNNAWVPSGGEYNVLISQGDLALMYPNGQPAINFGANVNWFSDNMGCANNVCAASVQWTNQ